MNTVNTAAVERTGVVWRWALHEGRRRAVEPGRRPCLLRCSRVGTALVIYTLWQRSQNEVRTFFARTQARGAQLTARQLAAHMNFFRENFSPLVREICLAPRAFTHVKHTLRHAEKPRLRNSIQRAKSSVRRVAFTECAVDRPKGVRNRFE
jgi:hypothetical protein